MGETVEITSLHTKLLGSITNISASTPPSPLPLPVLRKLFQGVSFFDHWEFEEMEDPTHGMVR